MCKIYSEYLFYIKGLHDKYKRECCKFPSEKCHNPMKLDYFCKNDDLFNKLKCDINNGVAAASSEHERSQTMDGTQENDISHSVSSSSLEHHTDENVDGITNNTDYYPKRGVSFSFWGILSAFLYLYKVISNYIWKFKYFTLILIAYFH